MTQRRITMDELVAHFSELEDPRSAVNRRHPFISVIVIAIMAVLAGASGPTAIAQWAEDKKRLLIGRSLLPNGVPRKDVFRRVLMTLKPAAFQACFVNWLASLRASAADATLSGTLVAASSLIAIHLGVTRVACRSHRMGLLLKGGPRTLVKNGEVDWQNLRRSHISEEDLREALRLNANLDEMSQVKIAVKERSGEIGVVKNARLRVVEVQVQEGVQTIRLVMAS